MGQSGEKPPDQTSQHGFSILPLLLKQNRPPPCLVSAVSEREQPSLSSQPPAAALASLPSIPLSFKPSSINFPKSGLILPKQPCPKSWAWWCQVCYRGPRAEPASFPQPPEPTGHFQVLFQALQGSPSCLCGT